MKREAPPLVLGRAGVTRPAADSVCTWMYARCGAASGLHLPPLCHRHSIVGPPKLNQFSWKGLLADPATEKVRKITSRLPTGGLGQAVWKHAKQCANYKLLKIPNGGCLAYMSYLFIMISISYVQKKWKGYQPLYSN